jgi:hypothetical protein
MTVVAIAIGYALIGAVIAAPVLARRRGVDALLLLGLWPMYGPFLLLGSGGDQRERALAAVLRDRDAAIGVLGRVRDAVGRMREMDELRARPDPHGVSVRLRALRDRRAEELAAVEALIAEVVARAEVARFTGDDQTEMAEVVGELLARVECLAE